VDNICSIIQTPISLRTAVSKVSMLPGNRPMHSNDSKDTIRCFRLTRGQHRSGIMAVPVLNSVLWELILFFCCPSFRNLTCSCWQASAEQKSQREWAPPPLREGNGYGSSDTEYPYSGSDDDVSDGPYSDDNSDDNQPSVRSSGESSGESEVDQVSA